MKFDSRHAAAIALVLLLRPWSASAAELSPVGLWRTVDEDTGEQTGLIEITQSGDELVGRIVKMIPQPGDPADPVCGKCGGAQKDKRVLGMTILKGFRQDGDRWDGGTILDPRSGFVYSAEIRLDDSGRKLLLRGYVGIPLLGRTTVWTRSE